MLIDNSKTPGGLDDKLTLMINITTSGLPDDCMFISNLDVSKDLKIPDIKDMIITLPYF